jgi:hypothetical protein
LAGRRSNRYIAPGNNGDATGVRQPLQPDRARPNVDTYVYTDFYKYAHQYAGAAYQYPCTAAHQYASPWFNPGTNGYTGTSDGDGNTCP